MFCKTIDDGYYNMLTGTHIQVKQSSLGDFRVQVTDGHNNLVCLQKGYRSEEDAKDALDDTMSGQDIVSLEVPEYEALDDSDEEDNDGESEEATDDYSRMSVTDLKSAIENRNEDRVRQGFEPLSTTGNKKALVARLREDDAVLAQA